MVRSRKRFCGCEDARFYDATCTRLGGVDDREGSSGVFTGVETKKLTLVRGLSPNICIRTLGGCLPGEQFAYVFGSSPNGWKTFFFFCFTYYRSQTG